MKKFIPFLLCLAVISGLKAQNGTRLIGFDAQSMGHLSLTWIL